MICDGKLVRLVLPPQRLRQRCSSLLHALEEKLLPGLSLLPQQISTFHIYWFYLDVLFSLIMFLERELLGE